MPQDRVRQTPRPPSPALIDFMMRASQPTPMAAHPRAPLPPMPAMASHTPASAPDAAPRSANELLMDYLIRPSARALGGLFQALDAPPSRNYPADMPYASPLRVLGSANALLPAAAGLVADAVTGQRPTAPVVNPMAPIGEQATFAGEAERRGLLSMVRAAGTLADLLVGPEHGLAAAVPLLASGAKLAHLAQGARASRADNVAAGLYHAVGEGKKLPMAVEAMRFTYEPTGAAVAPVKEAPIIAYHGSPHAFERFDARKIGTGEGAQAYGYGLYFGEAPDTATNYAPRNEAYEGKLQKLFLAAERAGDYDAASVYEQAMIHDLPFELRDRFKDPRYEKALQQVERISPPGTHKVMKVAIHADPESFLDWDKPLSQQPKPVQEYLAKKDPDMWSPSGNDYDAMEPGSSIYRRLHEMSIKSGKAKPARVKEQEAVKDISHAGITGIKYLDQGSRGAGEGTRNFVVFPGNESRIEILAKYGLLPFAVGAGGSLGGLMMAGSARPQEAR